MIKKEVPIPITKKKKKSLRVNLNKIKKCILHTLHQLKFIFKLALFTVCHSFSSSKLNKQILFFFRIFFCQKKKKKKKEFALLIKNRIIKKNKQNEKRETK